MAGGRDVREPQAPRSDEQAEAMVISELLAARDVLDKPDIHLLLRLMVERGASDLHIKVGSPPGLRIDGEIVAAGGAPLTPADTFGLVQALLLPEQMERFEREGDLDLSYAIPDLSRFRVNVLTQRGTLGLVARRIPEEVPSLEDLMLPEICRTLADKARGLVLVTGPTGAGKSTTLAAMIDHVNRTRSGHIVTMEDPIEFLHRDKKCWVTQREIGSDSKDFPNALRRALRQDPDVILVGEMRDLETISLAVTAAETGHLVFGTLHTTSAIQTVNRIVDVFPPGQQQQIRTQLADNLQAILSQNLLPRASGRGRVAAIEILIATDAVRAMIRESKTPQILNLIQTGGAQGMQTFDDAVCDLLEKRKITMETALANAYNPQVLKKVISNATAAAVATATPGAPPPPVGERTIVAPVAAPRPPSRRTGPSAPERW